jgi:V-type H+-transporting ATPase subunit A
LRRSCLDIVRAEADLTSTARIVGGIDKKLSEQEQATLSVAKIIREDLIQQNMFTPYDCQCSLFKATWMMRNIVLFHSLAQAALSPTTKPSPPVKTWLEVKQATSDLIYRLASAKFADFEDGRTFVALERDLRETFANLGCGSYLSSF